MQWSVGSYVTFHRFSDVQFDTCLLSNNQSFSPPFFLIRCQQWWLDSNPRHWDNKASVLPLCYLLLPPNNEPKLVMLVLLCYAPLHIFQGKAHFTLASPEYQIQVKWTLDRGIMRQGLYHCASSTCLKATNMALTEYYIQVKWPKGIFTSLHLSEHYQVLSSVMFLQLKGGKHCASVESLT